jgi:sterol desaturase/sphingolipid hydroxylase (fatty acid hydroxylase superfamily)
MWQKVLDHFQTLEQRPVERMVLLVGGMLLLWIVEGAIPLIALQYKRNKWRHASINFTFTIIHLFIHTGFGVLIVLLSDACKRADFGLVNWMNSSVIGTLAISFLVLDLFASWLVHLVQHKVRILWRFHMIHHSDNNVDVTTGLRHHPIESVLRGVFFLLAVLISGAPVYAVMFYQTFLVLSTQFTHANISLPRWIDRALSYVFVSPNMHKVHHHWQQPYTDSNYGAVLAIWDRLFGTYQNLEPTEIRYGLDHYYPNEEDENLSMLLKKPFTKIE